MNIFIKTKNIIFLLFLLFVASSSFFVPQKSFAQTARSCWVTDFGTPGSNITLPPECARGRVPCTSGESGHICAYKNLVAYTSIGDGWGANRGHQGVDLITRQETPLYAIEDGVVISNRFEGCNRPGVGYAGPGSRVCTPADGTVGGQSWDKGQSTGWHVKLHDKNKRFHFYMHLVRKSTLQVGQTVRAGDIVGYAGSTGNSGTPHLHYQISYPCNDQYNCWSDPAQILKNWPNY